MGIMKEMIPVFTQPLTYKEIKQKKSIFQIYRDNLKTASILKDKEDQYFVERFKIHFDEAHQDSIGTEISGEICSTLGKLRVPCPDTSVSQERITKVANTLISVPNGFSIHPKLKRILEKRNEALLANGSNIDWGLAEALAFGTLIEDDVSVRLSGQDCGRGTFSQRHLLLNDYETGESFLPLSQLSGKSNAAFEVYNSTLSESAVMGFEFGYTTEAESSLVLWEAQFGDFANGAQVIIDQFVSSSEQKWNQFSGLVLLLPHGYEGQGPEHSSARLERFLQICAEGNMLVCYPSCAAQYFHLLRRQGLMTLKRPMIVMTPKSLLRFPGATSNLTDLTEKSFQTVIADPTDSPAEHVVFLSGKVYYDIRKGLDEKDINNVRLARIEQLYPFPTDEIREILEESTYKTITWVQEEPSNMGARFYIDNYFERKFNLSLGYAGRKFSASTATGSLRRHLLEQTQIVSDLIAIVTH